VAQEKETAMMTMTIAHWKLVVQVRRRPAGSASDATQQLVQRARRRELDAAVARTRAEAETRRLLRGGPTPR
jgi:hypothetical protein